MVGYSHLLMQQLSLLVVHVMDLPLLVTTVAALHTGSSRHVDNGGGGDAGPRSHCCKHGSCSICCGYFAVFWRLLLLMSRLLDCC
jgi:hypothetical protein